MARTKNTIEAGGEAAEISIHLVREDGSKQKWVAARPVRSLKRRLRDLGADIAEINNTARDRAIKKARNDAGDPGLELSEDELAIALEHTDDEEDELMRLVCAQISVLSETVADGQVELGDELLARWEADEMPDDEVAGVLEELWTAVGKPNAS
jgi:hypothetical protein